MGYQSAWFIFLSLLQLCRAEITDTRPASWYSANVINDGYQPKPITEIFSTDAAFSQTLPIIVVPNSDTSSEEASLWSTHTPSIQTFSTNDPLNTKMETTPATVLTSTEEITKSSLITASTSASQDRNPVSVTISTQTVPDQNTVAQTIRPIIPEIVTTEQPKGLESNTRRSTNTPRLPPLIAPQPNFFVIYQQNPQNIHSVPDYSQTSSQTAQSQTVPQISSEPTILPQSSSTITLASIPPFSSPSTPLPSSPFTSSTATIREDFTNTQPTRGIQSPTPRPMMPLKIRVLAPSGSITNIKINPTTTTRKPTTKKPKPKKNLYNICSDSCEKRKVPICAAPLSSGLIDPSTLKGFPSICHMACHNAFKQTRYEKLVDGRCGKLRTRIRPVDSKTKLKRTELIKAEYVVDNTGPQAIVQFGSFN